MPEKYHIETRPVPPRRPRIGKYGIIDWREDCARCHNCVKKACVYDRHREEAKYIRELDDVDALFFDCMGCLSCVQECTKNLLRLTINPEYKKLGNDYWTPQIIQTTWLQAETAKIPVSGAGYGGRFYGYGFDSMWTDMSEIVRPTRDGIHGREYISTAVDIGRKKPFLEMKNGEFSFEIPPIISTPMPMIIDMMPEGYDIELLDPVIAETAYRTGLIAVMDSRRWPLDVEGAQRYLPNIAFYFADGSEILPAELLRKTPMVEIENSGDIKKKIDDLKKINPSIVVAVRVRLDADGVKRAVELSEKDVEAIHIVADMNGRQTGTDKPMFIKDMIRSIHKAMIENGKRDDITIISGGGIALPEHMAKGVICGTDLVSVELALLAALECHLCTTCHSERLCPAKIQDVTVEYGAGRMTNLIAAWHDQLIELMGAMGMRDARRLRGDVGRAMFFEQLEEECFGRIFGTRKQA